MDFRLTPEEEELKKEFEDFFEAEMKNAPQAFYEAGVEGGYGNEEAFAFHNYMKRRMGEKGWLTRPWPKEYGGADATVIEQLIFNEAREKHQAPGIDVWAVEMFGPTIILFGTEEQKQRLLPPIVRGEVQYCQGWSEPDAGSDLANIQTLAIKDGDTYVVNGQKVWTSAAHRADHMFILARTDPDSTRSRGLSVFNLPMDTPGIDVRPILFMDKNHIYNEVFFKDVRIHESDRIGEENDGWRSTRETMNFERSGIGAYTRGKKTVNELIEYVNTTRRGGKLLADNPAVRQKIAKLYIDLELGSTLASKIAWMQQKGGGAAAASAPSESKVFSSELSQRIANYATEIMGLYGQVYRSKWSPLRGEMADSYVFSPGLNLAGGSSEIQRNLIAWVGLGLPRYK